MLAKLRDFFSFSEWVIRYTEGESPVVKGEVHRGFVIEATSVFKEAKLPKARLSGEKKGGRVALIFDHSIPRSLHQRLRNLWNLHQSH